MQSRGADRIEEQQRRGMQSRGADRIEEQQRRGMQSNLTNFRNLFLNVIITPRREYSYTFPYNSLNTNIYV